MVNNVGKTTDTLNKNLGDTTSFTTDENITLISGEIGRGLLLFDPVGTLGVVSNFTSESDFTVSTLAISIDVEAILGLSY